MFNCHSKTYIEIYYSESGSIPIRIKISARRLMFWWHIVKRDQSELINRVYSAQKLSTNSGDWVTLLASDKEQFDIQMSDSEIAQISEQKFKNFKICRGNHQISRKTPEKNSKPKQLVMPDQ